MPRDMALNINEYMFLNEYIFPGMDIISLNEYVFLERGYISLNELTDKFLEMNIIP